MNLAGCRTSDNFKIANGVRKNAGSVGFSKVHGPRAMPKFTVKNSSRFMGSVSVAFAA